MDRNTQEWFFRNFFEVMNASGMKYGVLHSWQTLPECATSDVDMVIECDGLLRLPTIFTQVELKSGWRMVQRLWYDVPRCYYFVAVSPDCRQSVALDFLSDPRGLGEYRIKDGILLKQRVVEGLVPHLTPECELAYKLAKRAAKGKFTEEDLEFVQDYRLKANERETFDILTSILPCSKVAKCKDLLQRMPGIEEWNATMKSMRHRLRLPGVNWSLHGHPFWWGYMIMRYLDRKKNASGCVLYIKGRCKSVDCENFDFGFVFRRVIFVQDLTNAIKREVFLKAWLLVVTGNKNAIEVIPGETVEWEGDFREAIFAALNRRYRNYYT